MKGNVVQIRNPKTGKYLKIDRGKGLIIGYKKTKGPFKGVTIINNKK